MLHQYLNIFLFSCVTLTNHINSRNTTFKTTSSKELLKTKRVAVVCCYFDGQTFIEEQLNSIFNQSIRSVHVFLSDDKSDNPFDIKKLRLGKKNQSRISVNINSQNLGYTDNFLKTLAKINDEFEYYSFSDQDDIWSKDKLQRALNALEHIPPEIPALYCGRTEIFDAKCENNLGLSPLFLKPPSFSNAIVQNIGGGNTMVFNRSAKDLIIKSTSIAKVVSHDWWCYQIISGAGGSVVYDPEPLLKYRQHNNNTIGSNKSWAARLNRIFSLLDGEYQSWNNINVAALEANSHLLTTKNQKILINFIEARRSSLIRRFVLFKKSSIYRQTLSGNLGLWLGVFLNKI